MVVLIRLGVVGHCVAWRSKSEKGQCTRGGRDQLRCSHWLLPHTIGLPCFDERDGNDAVVLTLDSGESDVGNTDGRAGRGIK